MFIKILLPLLIGFTTPFTIWAADIAPAIAVTAPKKSLRIAHGTGVTISFVRTSETIEKAWLDNPSFATLEYQTSTGEPSQILHLRRNEDLNLPYIAKTHNSLLTIVTKDRQSGEIKFHFYNIVKSSYTSQILEEIPAPPLPPKPVIAAKPSPPIRTSGKSSEELARKIKETLNHPQIKSQISRAKRTQLLTFANLIKSGTPEIQAMRLMGITEAEIKEILNTNLNK